MVTNLLLIHDVARIFDALVSAGDNLTYVLCLAVVIHYSDR